jgi:hypothetical protein
MTQDLALGRIDLEHGPVRIERRFPAPSATAALAEHPPGRATCTVTAWQPPVVLELRWRFTGEAPESRVRYALSEVDGATPLAVYGPFGLSGR